MADRYVIKIIGMANGDPCSQAGKYLSDFDADAEDGRGQAVVVSNPAYALQFVDVPEAFAFWKTQSVEYPLRRDNQPNRPLTAYTVEFVRV